MSYDSNDSGKPLHHHFEHAQPHSTSPVADEPPPHADTAVDDGLNERQRDARHPEYPAIGLPMMCRDLFAEFLGTFVLVLMGLAANVNAFVNWQGSSNYTAYTFGWGVGLLLALLLSIPYSGGHVNPAITISQAAFRGFPWRNVPGYILMQCLGAFLACIILNGIYYDLLDNVEGGPGVRTYGNENSTAQFWIAVPSGYITNAGTFWNEVMGAAMLLLCVACVSDEFVAGDWSMWTKALLMCWTLVGVNGGMGVKTPFALNPARDFGPRVASSCFGYPGTIWTDRSAYWVWGAWMGPIVGGLLVTALYDLAVRKCVRLTVPFLRRSSSGSNSNKDKYNQRGNRPRNGDGGELGLGHEPGVGGNSVINHAHDQSGKRLA